MTHSSDVPSHPRSHAGVAGRAARALTTAACALALATGALTATPAPARADDTITTQDYFSYYKLDSTRAKGYTGKGVTIAMIDGPVDTSAPELAGANITVKTPCKYEAVNASKTHATAIASILVSKNYGLAPDATLIAYSTPSADDEESCTHDEKLKSSSYGAFELAMNDGAQVISYSRSDYNHEQAPLKWAIARAMAQGVIIVGPIGNDARDENHLSLAWWSGTVGVSAVDSTGEFASYSSCGARESSPRAWAGLSRRATTTPAPSPTLREPRLRLRSWPGRSPWRARAGPRRPPTRSCNWSPTAGST